MRLDLADIQGNLLRGYHFTDARHFALAITDGAAPPADTSPDDKSDFGKFLDSLLGREPARAPN